MFYYRLLIRYLPSFCLDYVEMSQAGSSSRKFPLNIVAVVVVLLVFSLRSKITFSLLQRLISA